MRGRVLLALAILATIAAPALAQGPCGSTLPLVDPAGITTATASADHAATNPLDGTPLVAKYVIRVKKCVGQQEVKAYDLGKPTPDATNTLKFTLTKADIPVNTSVYLTWEAVAPSGLAGVSGPSVPFGFKGPATAPAQPGPTPTIQ